MTGASLFFPEEGAINGAQATQALAERATRAGAQLLTGRSVVRVQSEGPDHQVHLTDGVVRCHAVVFAANAQLGAIDPYFEDKIQSVREHAQAGVGSAETLPTPGRTQQGYARWNFHGPEHWVLAGCRWATPHLEVMETDDTVTLPIVQTKLDEFRQRIFPHLSANAPSHRWSYLIAHTCDGLPIVGPIPGSPSLVCCAGFQGQQWGLAPRLARAVADGLLTSRAPGIPDFFTPARFV